MTTKTFLKLKTEAKAWVINNEGYFVDNGCMMCERVSQTGKYKPAIVPLDNIAYLIKVEDYNDQNAK